MQFIRYTHPRVEIVSQTPYNTLLNLQARLLVERDDEISRLKASAARRLPYDKSAAIMDGKAVHNRVSWDMSVFSSKLRTLLDNFDELLTSHSLEGTKWDAAGDQRTYDIDIPSGFACAHKVFRD